MTDIKNILRGIKDGIRDEVIRWDEVEKCLDEKSVEKLSTLLDKANDFRKTLPKEKRRPWKTDTPKDVLLAQKAQAEAYAKAEQETAAETLRAIANKKSGKTKVTTFPAGIGDSS